MSKLKKKLKLESTNFMNSKYYNRNIKIQNFEIENSNFWNKILKFKEILKIPEFLIQNL